MSKPGTTAECSPYFSIVLPVYNRPRRVARAIESVLAQSFGDYELVVVDDGSTDETPSVLAGYSDRVRIFTIENCGPGQARNRGLEESCGKYVVFLDSDDIFQPWMLEVYHVILSSDESIKILGAKKRFLNDLPRTSVDCCAYENIFDAVRRDDIEFMVPTATAVRRDVLARSGGFIRKRMGGEDLDLWLRMAREPGFRYLLDPPVFSKEKHEGNLNRNGPVMLKGLFTIVLRDLCFRYRAGGYAQEKTRMIWKALSHYSQEFSRTNQPLLRLLLIAIMGLFVLRNPISVRYAWNND